MKTLVKMIMGLLIIVVAACTDENLQVVEENASVLTRNIIDEPSLTNPNLSDDWENQERILLSNGEEVYAPWVAGSQNQFDPDFAFDVKKKDGWVMLFHTFKDLGLERNLNYIFLYNRLTGFLKVFYYNAVADVTANNGMWEFRVSSEGDKSALFNLGNYVALTEDEREYGFVGLSNASGSTYNGFNTGWNGFEIELTYTQDYKNMCFGLTTYSNLLLSTKISGIIQSDISGTITKTTERDTGFQQSVATIGGNGAKKLIDTFAQKTDATLGKKILNALSELAKGGVASVIKKGLKLIFGSSVVTETQKVQLSSKGTIEMEGSSGAVLTGAPGNLGSVSLYNVMNHLPQPGPGQYSNKSIVLSSSTIGNGEEQYLGVWTLEEKPILEFSRYSRLDAQLISFGCIQKATLDAPYVVRKPSVVAKINPNLTPYITHHSTTVEYICADLGDNSYKWSMIDTELIYSDGDIVLKENPFNVKIIDPYSVIGAKVSEGNYDYFYDWGDIPPDNFYAVVTVDIDFDYEGEKHSISYSRLYKVDCKFATDNDYQILHSGKYRNPYIVD